MTTIDNIMALHNAASHAAVQYALLAQVSLRSERSMQALEDRNEANEALRTALTEAVAAQPVREPSCDTCKHCTVASQDSFEETCFICSHYYDSKYEVKT